MRQLSLFDMMPRALFSILLFLTAFLPTGTYHGIPLKYGVFGLVVVSLAIDISVTGTVKLTVGWKTMAVSVMALVLFAISGMLNGYPPAVVAEEFKLAIVFVAYLVFANLVLARDSGVTSARALFRGVFFGCLVYALAKTLAFVGLRLGFITFADFRRFVVDPTGYEPVGLLFVGGWSRLSYISLDLLALLAWPLFWGHRDILGFAAHAERAWMILYSFLLFVVVFSAFSRALFAVFALMLFILAVLYRSRSALVATALCIGVAAFNFPYMIELVEQRFFDQGHSDGERLTMIRQLLTYWNANPVAGWGVGAYVPGYIRSDELPFSYEVQFLSFLMKYGLAWVAVIAIVLWSVIWPFVRGIRRRYLAVPAMLIFWLALSMTNQYLFGSTAALAVLLYIIYWWEIRGSIPYHDVLQLQN